MSLSIARVLPSPIKRIVRGAVAALGYKLVPVEWSPPADFEPSELEILRAVSEFTMSTPERVVSLVRATRFVVRSGIPGVFVECGVWRGGSMMAVALALLESGETGRDLYLYDTFRGMTEPGEWDHSCEAEKATAVWRSLNESGLAVSIEHVRRNLESTGYPADRLHFVEGDVAATLPATAPPEIALLRLDTDWYESTKHELRSLYPRLSRGGILIVDDYGHWLGSKRATDEFFEQEGGSVFLNRVDYSARLIVKP